MGKRKKRQKRGYAVGLTIAFESMQIVIWKIFSERAMVVKTLKLGRKFENATKSQLYQFYEEIINDLRPFLQSGLRSILLLTPKKKKYATGFLQHIQAHHQWMLQEKNPNSAHFRELTGEISDMEDAAAFFQSEQFNEAVGLTTNKEADQVVALLEKRLNDIDEGLVLFSIKEIESLVFAGGKRKKKFKPLKLIPEYILLTTQYLEKSSYKSRIQRLLQIAKNREIKIKILNSENPASDRIEQLGGIVCFLKTRSEYEKQAGERIINRE